MPPRYAYWTILFGGQPTAFRSATPDELLPTFKQIQSKHPDAVMMWFARGRLWKSPEEAREALFARRDARAGRERSPRFGDRGPAFEDRGPRVEGRGEKPRGEKPRGRDWRPGGEHRDPRDRFKVPRDVKRARFKATARFRKTDEERRKPRGPFKKKDDK
jgi:hypothetical protein